MKVAVHCSQIDWHKRYGALLKRGLERHGVNVDVTDSRTRTTHDIAILLGPNVWKEAEVGEYIVVNRAFVGNYHNNVAISWDGFNGRGDFALPMNFDRSRLDKFIDRQTIKPYNKTGREVICGQACPGRAPINLEVWYREMIRQYPNAYFRPHPNKGSPEVEWDMTGCAITLNSTVAVEALINGNTVISKDKGNPLYGFTSHERERIYPDQHRVLEILANCQWTTHEIERGVFWERLNTERRGMKLHELQ